MSKKVMTKFNVEVIEYDKTGYYYPKYTSHHVVISDSVENAKKKAKKRAPWQHNFGGGWTKRAKIIDSEDVVVEEENAE